MGYQNPPNLSELKGRSNMCDKKINKIEEKKSLNENNWTSGHVYLRETANEKNYWSWTFEGSKIESLFFFYLKYANKSIM